MQIGNDQAAHAQQLGDECEKGGDECETYQNILSSSKIHADATPARIPRLSLLDQLDGKADRRPDRRRQEDDAGQKAGPGLDRGGRAGEAR
jgi:hypothetical protein